MFEFLILTKSDFLTECKITAPVSFCTFLALMCVTVQYKRPNKFFIYKVFLLHYSFNECILRYSMVGILITITKEAVDKKSIKKSCY
jgi:hypothetical protein